MKEPLKLHRAMVLAAGLGTRMRPITDTMPKPLVKVAGKPLLDHMLDRLADQGVEDAVVNTHYLGEQIKQHVRDRARPRVTISDESDAILGTGGGVVRALAHLGDAPFFHVNSDSIWIEGPQPNLSRMANRFDADQMDALLLLAPTATSFGYDGDGDYLMLPDGALRRRKERLVVPFVYAGVAVLSPRLFADAPSGEFSLTTLFDRAEQANRLFGIRLEGTWMHVGTPEAIEGAERVIALSAV